MDRALELAYQEGTRTLGEQQASRESATSRTGVVFAVAAVGSGVLAEPALADHQGTPWLAWVAIVSLAATVAAVVVTVRPRKWRWTLEPKWFISKEGTSADDLNRELGGHLQTYITDNDKNLAKVWRSLRWSFASAGVSLVSWLLLQAGVWS